MLELTNLQDVATNLGSLTLEYSSNVEFELLNAKRRKILTQKIIDGLESFKYLVKDTELVVAKEVGEEVKTEKVFNLIDICE